jgi:hypothetical protein
MKYVLVADQPFRLGRGIYESIGPFDSVKDAADWYDKATAEWAVKPPSVRCLSLMHPSED